MGSAGFFEVLDKIVNVYWQNLIDYTAKIRLLIGALLALGFVMLTIPGWEKTKNDPKKRKVLLICFGIIIFSILFFITIISSGSRFSR
jgi:hypothetical protein